MHEHRLSRILRRVIEWLWTFQQRTRFLRIFTVIPWISVNLRSVFNHKFILYIIYYYIYIIYYLSHIFILFIIYYLLYIIIFIFLQLIQLYFLRREPSFDRYESFRNFKILGVLHGKQRNSKSVSIDGIEYRKLERYARLRIHGATSKLKGRRRPEVGGGRRGNEGLNGDFRDVPPDIDSSSISFTLGVSAECSFALAFARERVSIARSANNLHRLTRQYHRRR